MQTKLVWVTPDAEKLIAYIARVSSSNQENPEYEGLLKYLIKNKHWSPFEMASMCVEINTTRAISQQIVRHRSFSFQEFSQRYQEIPGIEWFELRKQAETNRQSSTEVLVNQDDWQRQITYYLQDGADLFQRLINMGVAKECARMVLPMCSSTKIYMSGTIRSWIHYFQIRCDEHTQKEHRDIACEIRDKYFKSNFPTITKTLGWDND